MLKPDSSSGERADDTCGSNLLSRITVPSDRLAVSPGGTLTIAGHDVGDLLASFGSPLYVTAEETLRENYRAILRAFDSRWPGGVDIFYAIKTNNTLAIRSVLHQEGAGGECFGPVELRATIEGGAKPSRIIVNGSDKQAADLHEAACLGTTINIDSEEELALLDRPGRGRPTRVNLRLKLLSDAFDTFSSEFFKTDAGIREAVRRSKWGYSIPVAVDLVRRIRSSPHMTLLGYSCHVGRFSNLPSSYAVVAAEFAKAAHALHRETGFWPSILDLGGGWARQREPESRAAAMNPYTIDDYAAAVTDALKAEIGAGLPLPRLWLEPGRYIVGNAVVLLATVGAVKRDVGRVWVHVDASTNQLMRIDTSRSWHAILPASRMHDVCDDVADIVGPTCIPSVLGTDRAMPTLRRGDILAILDAGMYAESISNQFNGMPRPANVLLSAGRAEVIRERETYEDIFARHRIPDRLRPAAVPTDRGFHHG